LFVSDCAANNVSISTADTPLPKVARLTVEKDCGEIPISTLDCWSSCLSLASFDLPPPEQIEVKQKPNLISSNHIFNPRNLRLVS
jgi:hypothetical protein